MPATLTLQDKEYRYRNMRDFMSRVGVSAMICSGEGACKYIGGEFYNTRWVTMVMFADSDPVAFVALPGREYLLTVTKAKEADYWVKDTRISSPPAIAALIHERVGATAKVGITLQSIPAAYYFGLQVCMPDVSFTDISDGFKEIYRVKTGNELTLLRRSPESVDLCCARTAEVLRPGWTENQIWGEWEHIMRGMGSPDTLNQSHVHKRDISAVLPNWCSSQRPLEKGDLMVAEITSSAGGYWTQKIETISMGEPAQVVKDMNAAGAAAIAKAAALVRPGVNARDLLNAMDDEIEAAGFLSPRGFLAGPQGHLSGLECDEGTFYLDQDFILKEGMLFVLHPSVAVKGWQPNDYAIFGPGTMYLVTADGAECLNKYPNDIIVIDC